MLRIELRDVDEKFGEDIVEKIIKKRKYIKFILIVWGL